MLKALKKINAKDADTQRVQDNVYLFSRETSELIARLETRILALEAALEALDARVVDLETP